MAGWVGRYCRSYSGCGGARLWRGCAAAAALLAAVSAGGCSISYQVESFLGDGNKAEVTGSIPPAQHHAAQASKKQASGRQAGKLPSDADLVYARAAASEVLRRNEKNASLPWENPSSGARGTVTPIASAYTQSGHTCRNFLASYVQGSNEAWLTGEACKLGKDAWEVRSLKPWSHS